jgi:hypothetical protein
MAWPETVIPGVSFTRVSERSMVTVNSPAAEAARGGAARSMATDSRSTAATKVARAAAKVNAFAAGHRLPRSAGLMAVQCTTVPTGSESAAGTSTGGLRR